MNNQDFTTTFLVDQSPAEAFATIMNVRAWWSGEIEGQTAQLGDEFTYRYKDIHYSKQRLIEVVPGKKVVWLVLEAHLSFTENKEEWKGTTIVFEVAKKGAKTEVRFTHQGLRPSCECFDGCSQGWDYYINESLQPLIASGKGQPKASNVSASAEKR